MAETKLIAFGMALASLQLAQAPVPLDWWQPGYLPRPKEKLAASLEDGNEVALKRLTKNHVAFIACGDRRISGISVFSERDAEKLYRLLLADCKHRHYWIELRKPDGAWIECFRSRRKF